MRNAQAKGASSASSSDCEPEELFSLAMAIVQQTPLQDRAGRRTMLREPKSGSLSPDSSTAESSVASVSVNPLIASRLNMADTWNLIPQERRFDMIDKLPVEISMHIFSFFDDISELNVASRVSKTWKRYARERSLWAHGFKQREPLGWKTMDDVEVLWAELKNLYERDPDFLAASTDKVTDDNSYGTASSQYKKVRSWLGVSDQSTQTQQHTTKPRIEFKGKSPFSMNIPLERITGPVDYNILFWARHLLNRHWDLHQKDILPISLEEAKALDFLQKISTYGDSDRIEEVYRSHPSFAQALQYSRNCPIMRAQGDQSKIKPDISFLDGHTDSVYCVRLHPKPFQFPTAKKIELEKKCRSSPLYDAKASLGLGSRGRIYSGSRDKTIKIWDADSGLCLFTLEGHQGSVLCMDYDEEVLVTGSSDSNVFVWDLSRIKDGEHPTIIKKLTLHNAGVLDVCMTERYVISCSKDATCGVYDRYNDYKVVLVYRGHAGPVNACGISSLEGVSHAVTVSGEGSIQLWNLLTGELVRTFEGHSKGLACVRIVGNTIISGSSDHTVRVWDAKSGNCMVLCDAHSELVRAVAFDDVRKILISASYDGQVKLYDLRRHLLPTSFHVEGGSLVGVKADLSTPTTSRSVRHRVFDVQMDATRVVSCGETSRICIRDFTRGNPIMRLFV